MRALPLLLLLACGGNAPDKAGQTGATDSATACDDGDGDGVCDEDDACMGGDDGADADGDGVPDACDTCDGGDDLVDSDGDAIPDDCDECPDGDNVADSDGDGIPDGCDACPNGEPGTFQWVTWDALTSGSKTITGSVGDTAVTYTSTSAIRTSSEVFGYSLFPASYKIPNVDPTILNSEVTTNTLSFGRQVVDPVLVFASIGRSSIEVTVSFDDPITVEWSTGLTATTSTSVSGREGYAVITVPGVHDEIVFSYDTAEYYANFVFGFAGTDEDIDGDGQADFCDPCPEDPDDACE